MKTITSPAAIIALAVSLIMAASAAADTIKMDGITLDNITITAIAKGKLTYTNDVGTKTIDMAKVSGIRVDQETDFNKAQTDYEAKNYDAACTEYAQASDETAKTWIKTFCQPLLTDSADKAGRFDLAVQGYLAWVQDDPAAALQRRPKMPDPTSPYLDAASATLSSAADNSSLTADQQNAILQLWLDVAKTRQDSATVATIQKRLGEVVATQTPQSAGGDNGSDSGTGQASAAPSDPAATALTSAQSDLQQNNFDAAVGVIQQSMSAFITTPQKADALYALAQAREGQAGTSGDSTAWQDTAIAYMRVVAEFKNADGAPHVTDSLLRAASILEKNLKRPEEAEATYQSIVDDYPNTPAAESAKTEVSRLHSGAKAN